ncbi:hypothetical protein [Algoriphagus aquimarinus]|uniref:hypothetical protein n=1 Tax=Algoriphagus aquimarinus TaxID=237018 RepID=UPI0030D8BF88
MKSVSILLHWPTFPEDDFGREGNCVVVFSIMGFTYGYNNFAPTELSSFLMWIGFSFPTVWFNAKFF